MQGLAVLLRLLAPTGLLCLGHAESLDPEDTRFERVGPDGFFLYRQKTKPSLRPSRPAANPPPLRPRPPEPPAPIVERLAPEADPQAVLLAQARQQADEGQLAEALAQCLSVQERFGLSADLCSLMGVIQQARHKRDEAVQSFRKALYLNPDHPEGLLHLMLLYQQQGERDQAAQLRRRLDRLAAQSPISERARPRLGGKAP